MFHGHGLSESHRAKPRHLDAEYAAQFGDEEVAAAYRHRPPYPSDTFHILEPLLASRPRTVVELGAGTGDLTIGLAPLVERLIAVEPSRAMLERGRRRTVGYRHIEWLAVAAEDYAFDGRYAAIVAAEAFHWLDWHRVLPRIARSLIDDGHLILVDRVQAATLLWDTDLRALIRACSTNQDYAPYDTVTELESRRLVTIAGQAHTDMVVHHRRIDDYVESFHSRNGFSRARLTTERAREFDERLKRLVRRYCPDDVVYLPLRARVTWLRPAGKRSRA